MVALTLEAPVRLTRLAAGLLALALVSVLAGLVVGYRPVTSEHDPMTACGSPLQARALTESSLFPPGAIPDPIAVDRANQSVKDCQRARQTPYILCIILLTFGSVLIVAAVVTAAEATSRRPATL